MDASDIGMLVYERVTSKTPKKLDRCIQLRFTPEAVA